MEWLLLQLVWTYCMGCAVGYAYIYFFYLAIFASLRSLSNFLPSHPSPLFFHPPFTRTPSHPSFSSSFPIPPFIPPQHPVLTHLFTSTDRLPLHLCCGAATLLIAYPLALADREQILCYAQTPLEGPAMGLLKRASFEECGGEGLS